MSSPAVTKTSLQGTKCAGCGTHFTPPGRGRPKRFCSGACRKRVHLARHRLAEVMGTDDSDNQDSTSMRAHASPSGKAIQYAAQATPLEQDVAEKVAEKYMELKPSASIEAEGSGSLTATMSATDVEQLRNEAEQEIRETYDGELAAFLAAAAAAVLAGGLTVGALIGVTATAVFAVRAVVAVAIPFAVRAAEATHPDGGFSEADFAALASTIQRRVTDALMDEAEDEVTEALEQSRGESEAIRGIAIRTALNHENEQWRNHAERVAATTATQCVNAGILEGARRAWRDGTDLALKWRTRQDSRVRRSHRAVDGEVREVGGTWRVGSSYLRFPGDPAGPPDETINCRCLLVPVPGGASS